jgi:Curli production assembly/transport component CsgG
MRTALLAAPLALLCAAPSFAARDGDILRLFEKKRVAVLAVPELLPLADSLLAGCRIKERLSQPEGAEIVLRLSLEPESEESVLRAVRAKKNLWEITLTAPDQGNLTQLIRDFRRLKEPPKEAIRQAVRSVAIIPIGPGAAAAASPLLIGTRHLARPDSTAGRRDEIVLWDRSVPGGLVALPPGAVCGPLDTLAWRESLPGGRIRAVIAAPSASLLGEAIRRLGDPLSIAEVPTVVASARDLRAVRKVAVTGLGESRELTKQLAALAATGLRSLGAFEVLERDGLSALLSEVALSQAGITEAPARKKLAQLAAADTLLIVELAEVSGQTEYSARHERLTPKLGAQPARPLEPSRYRLDTGNDPIARAAAEALLGPKLGLRSEREYAEAMDDYRFRVLPAWERALYNYQQEKRSRRVAWTEKVTARGSATLRGSVRLVSLTDGAVLWEAPLSTSESGESAQLSRTISTLGEDSVPRAVDTPSQTSKPPTGIALRAGESALAQALAELPRTALLPTSTVTIEPLARGTVIDLEASSVLVELGSMDGVKPGDVLLVRFPDSTVLRLIVTKARPRSCEAAFEPETSAAVRSKLTAGLPVELAR